jgi:hypothetical protein
MFPIRDVFTASVLVIVVVSIGAGALIGMLIGQVMTEQRLAMMAAFFSLAVAWGVHRLVVAPFIREKRPQSLPTIIVFASLLSSILGGLAAHVISSWMVAHPPTFLVGSLAGLLAAVGFVLHFLVYCSARAAFARQP